MAGVDIPTEVRWDGFVLWAERWYRWEGFRDFERGYKDDIVGHIELARKAVRSNAPNWIDVLHRAFGRPNNLTDWRDHDTFLKWVVKFPELARSALLILWDPKLELDGRVRGFVASVSHDALPSPLPITSFLLMGVSPKHYPIYRKTPIATGCKLVGFPPVGGEVDRAAEYRHALRFLDRFIVEAGKRGLDVADRLDAQSLVWCMTMEEPPIDWSDKDRDAFLQYRGRSSRSTSATAPSPY